MIENNFFYQEAIKYLRKNKKLPPVYLFQYANHYFIGLNDVFSPPLFEDTFFFSEHINVSLGTRFLEIGCGTGVIAVMKAIEGCIVTASDINDSALKNTRMNAIINNVENSISIVHSDVFNNIKNLHEFDIIFWNMPFIYANEDTVAILDNSCFCYKYEAIGRFINGVKSTITTGTKVLFGFSAQSGQYNLLLSMANKENLNIKLICEKKLSNNEEPEFYVGLYALEANQDA